VARHGFSYHILTLEHTSAAAPAGYTAPFNAQMSLTTMKLPFIEWLCIWESIRAESGQTFSWPAENVSTETGQRKCPKPYLNSIGIQWWNYSWGVSPVVVQEFESDSGS
jgi:hypothetical protein